MKTKKIIIGAAAVLTACTVAISASLADNGIGTLIKKSVKRQESPQATPTVWEYETKGYKNSWDYLLARDGFIYGMDYNWCTDNMVSGNCLGTNHILNNPAVYNHDVVSMDFYNIKQLGFNATAWWLMPDGQGITYDDDGLPLAVDQEFFDNMRDMLDIARANGLYIVPALIPHGWASNNGQGNGELTYSEIYNKYFRYMWDEKVLDTFITNVIDPVNKVLAEYKDIVICVALNVENTTVGVDDFDKGYYEYGTMGTTWENYSRYLNALHDSVKKYMPETPTSIEMGGGQDQNNYADEKMFYQNDLKVDFISENYYHSGGGIESPANGYATRPGYIGEYNGGESGFDDKSQEYWASIKHKFNKSAKQSGWMGAFYYSYSTGGPPFNCMSGLSSDYDTFYYWAISFRYDIHDQINEFKGVKDSGLEKAALLYNRGGSYAYWIPARGAVSYKLERSLDGGKTWSVAADGIDPDSANEKYEQLTNGLIKFHDTELKKGDNFCYRVTAKDENGNTSVSDVCNSADFFVAENLISDPGFESGVISTDSADKAEKWVREVGTADTGSITEEEKNSGKYALKIDTVNGKPHGYGNLCTTVKVKKGTIYKLEFYVKIEEAQRDSTADEYGYVRLYNAKTGLTIYGAAAWLSGTDGKWQKVSLTVNTGDMEELGVGISNGSAGCRMIGYYDDFSLTEVR